MATCDSNSVTPKIHGDCIVMMVSCKLVSCEMSGCIILLGLCRITRVHLLPFLVCNCALSPISWRNILVHCVVSLCFRTGIISVDPWLYCHSICIYIYSSISMCINGDRWWYYQPRGSIQMLMLLLLLSPPHLAHLPQQSDRHL